MDKKHIIINVGRQLGSGGHDIGRMLALDFGAKYYDRELLNLAAKESGLSEKIFEQNDEKKGFFRGLLNIGTPHVSSGYKPDLSQESLFQFQSDAIIKAAKAGSCVFVGRCADYVLREFDNTVNICPVKCAKRSPRKSSSVRPYVCIFVPIAPSRMSIRSLIISLSPFIYIPSSHDPSRACLPSPSGSDACHTPSYPYRGRCPSWRAPCCR